MATGKYDLAELIAGKTGITRQQAVEQIRAITLSIVERLAAGDQVKLAGFGTFLVRKREGREGRNPATGEQVMISPAFKPVFKPSNKFKDLLNR